MPAAITHYLHACDVRTKLSENGINAEKRMMLWGAQGPDIMFFHRALPHQLGKSLRRVGLLMHKSDPELLFKTMAELCRSEYKEAYSFALGFLCHYSLDCTAHPYVYAMQNKYISSTGFKHNPSYIHNLIEHNIDVIMLKEKRAIVPAGLPADEMLSGNSAVINRQSVFMREVLLALNLADVPPHGRIKAAFLDMRKNMPAMIDRRGKKRFISFLEKLLHIGPALSSMIEGENADGCMDYMNDKRAEWSNPFDKKSARQNITFRELYDKSADDSVNLIMKFTEYIKTGSGSITGGLTFSHGVPYSAYNERK